MVKAKYTKYLLKLSKAQAKKLAKNQNTLIKPDQMEGGTIEVCMTPAKHRKMMTALKKQKGMKLGLTPEELEETMCGCGFKDLLKTGAKSLAKEAKPLVKKAVSKAVEKYVGKEAGDAIGSVVSDVGEKAVNMATGGKLPRGQHLSGLDASVGGKVDLMKIAKTVSSGYKKYVKDTPIGDIIRKGAKTALETGAVAIPTALGVPEAVPITTALVSKYGDTAIQKAGLGVLQSNHSNFLNTFHPAMSPHIPSQGITDLPRMGGSFVPAGRSLHGGSFVPAGRGMCGGSFLPAGRGIESMSGTALHPKLPQQGYTDVPRTDTGLPIHYQPSTSFFSGN